MPTGHAEQESLRSGVRRLAAVLLLPALVGLAGCSAGKGDVSGKVTFKGQPVPAGRVTFVSEAGNQTSLSAAITDGQYTLSNFPAGPAKISVETFAPVASAPPGSSPSGPGVPPGVTAGFKPPENGNPYASAPGRYVQIPQRYANTDQSGLKYVVTPGKQEHAVELSD